jgi:succinylarginine dihydrolase
MWAANAGTFTPACDASDGRHHLTLANLASSWHRAAESRERLGQLSTLFAATESQPAGKAVLHDALPSIVPLRDEGAANHMRLCDAEGTSAVHIFVYGQADLAVAATQTMARQTLAASQAVARLHGLDPSRTFYLQQHPHAIEAGVFHNDVIATSHANMLLYHEFAFWKAEDELARIGQAYQHFCGRPLQRICIRQQELTLTDAVSSYFFNSQILTPRGASSGPSPGHTLVCAQQCQRMPQVRAMIERLVADERHLITQVRYVNLDESMAGGGGPACLRLRVQLPSELIDQFAPTARWTSDRDSQWRAVIEQYYPEQLEWERLGDPHLIQQYAAAYAAFAAIQ